SIPFRNKIKERLKQVWNFEKMSAPYLHRKRYFYTKNDGMQNQSVLYYKNSVNDSGTMILDPNQLAADGTSALGGWEVSKDGKYMQYSINKAGSDWEDFYVKDIASGKDLADHIKWIKFSGAAWKGDGFYYAGFDAPKKGSELTTQTVNQKIFFHKVGDDQSKDQLIYKDDAHTNILYGTQVTYDQNWLIVYTSNSTHGNGLMVKDLKANSPLKTIIALPDSNADEYDAMDVLNGIMLMRTNHNAPNFKLVAVDLTHPEEANWKTIIPEAKNYMVGLTRAGNYFIAHYLEDVKSKLVQYDLDGNKICDIPTTDMCSVSELSGDRDDSLLFIGIATFTNPPQIFKYNLLTKQSTLYFSPKFDFKSEEYTTEQVFYPSKDGTKIPMFITHKKGIKMDGTNPCFLFGYGGFNSHYAPEFRSDRAVFLESGGIYCVAGIRGGDEYGESWHQQGIKCNKQNVFDDFIAAAEYLIKEKYTSSEHLAITGRSNGGLLIGACETQRPDLYKVCIPQVGVMDMLRYHRFTVGRQWASDYGLSENKNEFECLFKYSPLQNLKPANYPATLVTTGDHDDRVVPAHSFKYAATLQADQQGDAPCLIRIDHNAGHGSGKPTDKQIEEWADIWSFVFYNLGMTY
ncbi:MAG TPA: prolyl oligopeptidase family serine peptidase, partial [Bacteroidia bacterium]|nr:prolyl oligopeptidase family serine peptidase [Bacteroidia bacterium]